MRLNSVKAIRFAAFSQEQKIKLNGAGALSGFHLLYDHFMPESKPDLAKLSDMKPEFADAFIQRLHNTFNNRLLRGLSEKERSHFQLELAIAVELLDKAPFRVPDSIVQTLAEKAGFIKNR